MTSLHLSTEKILQHCVIISSTANLSLYGTMLFMSYQIQNMNNNPWTIPTPNQKNITILKIHFNMSIKISYTTGTHMPHGSR